MPEALQWFIAAGDAELSDEQRAWHLRIALRTGDWAQVLAAISSRRLRALLSRTALAICHCEESPRIDE